MQESDSQRSWRSTTLTDSGESLLTFLGFAALAAGIWAMRDVCQSYDVRDLDGDLGAQFGAGIHIIFESLSLAFVGFVFIGWAIAYHLDRLGPVRIRKRFIHVVLWTLWFLVALWLAFSYRPFQKLTGNAQRLNCAEYTIDGKPTDRSNFCSMRNLS